MKAKEISVVLTLFLMSFHTISYSQANDKTPLLCSGGIIIGYNRGYGIQTNFTVRGFSSEFPFELRFGIGYSILNPGNAADARRIFINNATNGIPEKNGRSFDYRLDLLLLKSIFGIDHSYIVFGPRYCTFKGNFKYIGGNEDFDVTSKQWGIGGSIEHHFRMISNLSLVIHYGLDHYFPSTLTGHDTSYSPDNDNVNPTNDNQNSDSPFTYREANKAIKQPMFMPRAMIGVSFNL